ncbi:transcriptional regulator, TetR family [Kaistia soli DSM 19436]|uniref:Transcriptional regulator, TetR family n=1 Tax=Kaistia soli DSM 19436 TaxID=1122133 RepID=A0A1M5K2T3_9HYPH|nr:TetR/AcrR family transcriptional regulator [Kaistia soli]SHG47066.1 transcriptional regulator, TetR family [Kaistia soli DSM 19436]
MSSDRPDVTAKPRAAEKILNAARDLFYREGIRAVGVDEIVETAGVTKPSLYRSFPSKDELAAAYLRDYEIGFWSRFETALARHPGDPRAGIVAYFSGVSQRQALTNYRGCALTNAAVEFPEPGSPARLVSEANKRALRARLELLAGDMGADDPALLADGLLMLFEGANASGQIFGVGGPVRSLAVVADRLIGASVRR